MYVNQYTVKLYVHGQNSAVEFKDSDKQGSAAAVVAQLQKKTQIDSVVVADSTETHVIVPYHAVMMAEITMSRVTEDDPEDDTCVVDTNDSSDDSSDDSGDDSGDDGNG